jgi:hypothetical protein
MCRHEIEYGKLADAALLDTMKQCLQRDPKCRAPIAGEGGLLLHPYLNAVVTQVSFRM